MIKTDEDALVCDLAETYQIYDYKQLPASLVAVFSYGLKEDSRIKMKLTNQSVPLETLLLAKIADNLSMLVWFQTDDGQKGNNRPNSLVDSLADRKEKEKERDIVAFETGEDFKEQRLRLIKGGE